MTMTPSRILRPSLALALAASLAACGTLPRSAPTEKEFLGSAVEADAPIALYPVTLETVERFARWPRIGPHHDWKVLRGDAPGRLLAAGDVVSITIFDSAPTSLLAGEGERSVALDGLRLSPRGVVFLPYVGEVRIAGLSADRARRVLQDRIEPVIPGAQVQLVTEPGREQEVDLVAGVGAPGPYPLRDRGTTVLSAIAFGGGPSPALENPLVRLIRGRHDFAIALERLYGRPDLDTLVLAGDKVLLEEDDRTFTVVGAAGDESVFAFGRPEISLVDAIALADGVDANRADPEGVLVLREYPDAAVGPGGPDRPLVVFSADLTDASSLFAAKAFRVMPGDVIVPTESVANGFTTALALLGSSLGLVTRAGTLAD